MSSDGVNTVGDINTGPIGKLELPMRLMNPDDWIELSFIADGKLGYPEITSRIIGQTRATANVYTASIPARFGVTISIGFLGLIMIAGGLLLGISHSANDLKPWPALLLLAGIVALAIAADRQIRASVRRAVAYYDRSLPPPTGL